MNNATIQLKVQQRLNKLASQDYDNIECWQIVEAFNKAFPKYNNQGSDFFMGLGANILAAPGGNPILQTIGTAAKEPLNLMMKQNMAQSSSDRELVANLVKNLDDETLSAIQKDARAAVASGMFGGPDDPKAYNKAVQALLKKKIYNI